MTRTSDVSQKNLHEELRTVKKTFEVLLLAIEAEGIDSASEIAGRIVENLDRIIREMKHGYVQTVLESRFRSFSDDKTRFSDIKASSKGLSSEEFIEIVSRLERHIAAVDKEMNLLMPEPPVAAEWIRKYWRRIGAACLIVAGAVAIFQVVQTYMTRGKGLMGEYYTGANFGKLVARRRDLTIDFNLRNKAPIRRLTPDNFSVRWTGFIRIPSDGSYEFITRSDDGVRLYIDNAPVIDNWTIHRQVSDKAALVLKAGPHPIKLEWYQRRGTSTMQLYWRSGTDAQPKLIEADYLQPDAE